MRNNSFLFWLLFFVDGVFAADKVTVSVMVGDSVTLHTDDTETQGAQELMWKIQGENKFIAEIDKEINTISVPGNDEERFRGRLELDGETGSLTITKLKTTDSRVYELQIKNSKETKSKIFNVAVSDDVKSLSVMEGDSVTLHTDVANIQRDDHILWKFGDQGTIIADLNGAADSRWSNTHLNYQTGELTITNIRRNQSGDYEVEINTSSIILHRKFLIAVGGVKTESVMEGDPVNLHTGVIEIRGYDLILWKTEGNVVAEVNKETNLFGPRDEGDVRFGGRLHLHRETGDLTIRDSKHTDSGDYHLHMSNSAHTLERTIRVIVKTSRQSGAASGICSASVGLVVWTVFLVAGL